MVGVGHCDLISNPAPPVVARTYLFCGLHSFCRFVKENARVATVKQNLTFVLQKSMLGALGEKEEAHGSSAQDR